MSPDSSLPAPGQQCTECGGPDHSWCTPVADPVRAAALVEMHNAAHRITLTGRERECLDRIAAGLTDSEIAHELFLGPNTVKSHLSGLYRKLEARNRAHAVSLAWQHGLLDRRDAA